MGGHGGAHTPPTMMSAHAQNNTGRGEFGRTVQGLSVRKKRGSVRIKEVRYLYVFRCANSNERTFYFEIVCFYCFYYSPRGLTPQING